MIILTLNIGAWAIQSLTPPCRAISKAYFVLGLSRHVILDPNLVILGRKRFCYRKYELLAAAFYHFSQLVKNADPSFYDVWFCIQFQDNNPLNFKAFQGWKYLGSMTSPIFWFVLATCLNRRFSCRIQNASFHGFSNKFSADFKLDWY